MTGEGLALLAFDQDADLPDLVHVQSQGVDDGVHRQDLVHAAAADGELQIGGEVGEGNAAVGDVDLPQSHTPGQHPDGAAAARAFQQVRQDLLGPVRR